MSLSSLLGGSSLNAVPGGTTLSNAKGVDRIDRDTGLLAHYRF